MEAIVELTIKALAAFAIYAAVVVAYTLLGAWKNINIWKSEWSWKTWLNGLIQYAVLGAAVLTVMISSYSLIETAPTWGVELQGADQIAPRVIFGVIAAGIIGMLLKCINKIAEITGTSKDVVEKLQQSAIANPEGLVILDVGDLPGGIRAQDDQVEIDLKKATAGAKTDEAIKLAVQAYLKEIGGKGAIVPTDSPATFRNAVINNAYDVDGYFNAQCWDGAALFWLNAVGRSFSTGGTRAARGGWEAARAINAGAEFETITDQNSIQVGDWCVFGGSQWGHVGMAMSANLGNYIRLLGQNQTGTGNGAAFNEINMNLGNFLGAFRLKRWHASPAPIPTPAPTPVKNNETIADEVMLGAWGNNPERQQRLFRAGYDYNAIQAIVNSRSPEHEIEIPINDKPGGFEIGDRVVPIISIDYNGTPLGQFDDSYEITQVVGNRAVLSARGQIWAAMNTANIRYL